MMVSYQPRKFKKERVWTNAEMKYLALVLAEEKKQYAVRLETLALKNSSNNQVFEEISKDFEVTYVCQTSSKKRTNAQAFSTCFLGNPSRKLVHYKTRDESRDTPIVSKETVVLRRWERSKQKFGFIKRVDKG